MRSLPMSFWSRSLLWLLSCSVAGAVSAADPFTGASFLGGNAGDIATVPADDVAAAAIQPDGSIVLAAVVNDAAVAATAISLAPGTSTSPGAVVILANDGRTIIRVVRIAAAVRDVAVDDAGNIYVAALADGLIKLNPTGTAVLWRRTDHGICFRVDVTADGRAVGLWDYAAYPSAWIPDKAATTAYLTFHASDGSLSGDVYVDRGNGGPYDVAIDSATGTAFECGYKNTGSGGGLSVPYIRAWKANGDRPWSAYDYDFDAVFATNQTADSFLTRISMGRDGQLYALGYSEGGNSVFDRNTQDVTQTGSFVVIDKYNEGYRISSINAGFYGKYSPTTGALIHGSRYIGVTDDPAVQLNRSGQFFDTNEGAIAADEDGRVYVLASKNGKVLPYTFDPLGLRTSATVAHNGAGLTVVGSDFGSRAFCASVVNTDAGGRGHALAVRSITGKAGPTVVIGGRLNVPSGPAYTLQPIQAAPVGAADGWFAVSSALPIGAVSGGGSSGPGASTGGTTTSGTTTGGTTTGGTTTGTTSGSTTTGSTTTGSTTTGSTTTGSTTTGTGGDTSSDSSNGGCGLGSSLGVLFALGCAFISRLRLFR